MNYSLLRIWVLEAVICAAPANSESKVYAQHTKLALYFVSWQVQGGFPQGVGMSQLSQCVCVCVCVYVGL